jgi:DNA-3-methyladenine glycosylase II
MPAVPPFRLDLTVWALRRRPDNAVDTWDGHTYRRALEAGGSTIELAAVQTGTSRAPRLTVTLTGDRLDGPTEETARATLTRCSGQRSTFGASTASPRVTPSFTPWPRASAD